MIVPVSSLAPLFSIIIPTHNRARLLDAALDSVWAQRLNDFELIVVDDGSTDDTATVLRKYQARLKSLTQQQSGPAAARNAGARHARGRYLAFLDSDDVWFPWTLETYARAIAADANPALVLGAAVSFTSGPPVPEVVEAPIELARYDDYFAADDAWHCWGAGFAVVRRDVFHQAGGFAETLRVGEDADLMMRLGNAAGFVQVISPITLGYRRHPDSAMADLDQTLQGAHRLLENELSQQYPGGRQRAASRRRILGWHFRSLMLEAVRRGRHRDAWQLYRATFHWHLGLGRWLFLIGFPFVAAFRGHRA